MKKVSPDIRIHSNGAASSYGLRPLSQAGLMFVAGHAAMVKGNWQDGVFWFWDHLMPAAALRDTSLTLVAGIGATDEHDRAWPRSPL